MQFSTLLVLGLLAAAANVVGGLLLFPSTALLKNQRALKFLVALGAGFLLAVNFIEIIPRTLSLWMASPEAHANGHNHAADAFTIPLLLVLVGYLLVHFFEQTFTQHVHIGENQAAVIPTSVAYTA
jgi:zinc transporter ZupT